MGLKASSSFLTFLAISFAVFFVNVKAVNITRALEKYPEFSQMSDLFNKTGLTDAISKRQTITVLAIPNGAIGSISGRPTNEIKDILMNHVVLDYYDESKLKELKGKSSMLTTLYQTTGKGENRNGFLNCTKTGHGKIAFGSGVQGSPVDSEYVGTVFHNPYNLSIVQVSMPIVAPGLGAPVQAPPPPPFTPPPAPAPKKGKKAPAPGPAEDDDDADSPDMSPADAPDADDDSSPASAPGGKGKEKAPADADHKSAAASNAGLSFCVVLGFLASFAGL